MSNIRILWMGPLGDQAYRSRAASDVKIGNITELLPITLSVKYDFSLSAKLLRCLVQHEKFSFIFIVLNATCSRLALTVPLT